MEILTPKSHPDDVRSMIYIHSAQNNQNYKASLGNSISTTLYQRRGNKTHKHTNLESSERKNKKMASVRKKGSSGGSSARSGGSSGARSGGSSSARSGGTRSRQVGSAAKQSSHQPGLMECVQQRFMKDVFQSASGKR